MSIIEYSYLVLETNINLSTSDKPQCKPSGHRVLDSPARALSNKVKFSAPLCDYNLEEAWYKLEINGFPAMIPTSCPEIGSCGTRAQIWMPSEGHPGFGEERNSSACVAWEGVERVCCLWQLPVHVTHCGGFVVYRLRRTEECAMAYCAQEGGTSKYILTVILSILSVRAVFS